MRRKYLWPFITFTICVSNIFLINDKIFVGILVTNDWLFNSLGDEELFEDGYFFNLSSGDIIEVNLGSSLGTAEHTLEYESRGGSLSGGSELKHVNSATNFSHLNPYLNVI